MISHVFPPAALTLHTPRLELRLPTPDELAHLATTAAQGIHHPDTTPFSTPWTTGTPQQVASRVVLHHWRALGNWDPHHWALPLAAFHHGHPIGIQELKARHLATTHTVSTGSWLGQPHHGNGYGKEMRNAVLHLAFTTLGAHRARSAAFDTNPASLAVSHALGYTHDGTEELVVLDKPVRQHRLLLTRDTWTNPTPTTTTGATACLPWFGL
ncbi:GNAT family N-acetyltransferase [Actinokineospora pegani]|uniref:GNAT family N-acetyltransferase n=1 Tax=Actinokineospora pegani TaxID=2654637 RepID=UPI0012E9B9CF|nr:GNAT family N-acetyltransferase [Actinokineospora pegani]